MNRGVVVWFTGLPNAGKTTISKLVKREIESLGHPVEILDSDEVPRSLTKDLSPDWKTRQFQKCTNLIYIAKLLYKHDIIVLISSVGRFRQMRANARNEIENFVEVYLKCSQDVRLKRDEKAKYKRYPSTIHYYEEPVNPDIIIETDQCSSDCAAGKIMNFLTSKGYINRKTG